MLHLSHSDVNYDVSDHTHSEFGVDAITYFVHVESSYQFSFNMIVSYSLERVGTLSIIFISIFVVVSDF